jgi:hypothetical protein
LSMRAEQFFWHSAQKKGASPGNAPVCPVI